MSDQKENFDTDENEKKSIRDINIPENKIKIQENLRRRVDPQEEKVRSYKSKNSRIGLKIGVFVVIVLIVLVFIHIFFNQAKISLEPKKEDLLLENRVYSASKKNINEENSEEEKSDFNYEIFNVEFLIDTTAESIGSSEAEEFAEGLIEIFNNSNETQRLVKETRFQQEGSNSVYRIKKTTTISAGESIIVEVYADKAGASENLKNSGITFKIPGLKENSYDALYKNMYGLSTSSISGGFVGQTNIPSDQDLKIKKEFLKNEVEKIAEEKLMAKIPEEKMASFSNIYTDINYRTESEGDLVKIIAEVNVSTIVIEKSSFVEKIMEEFGVESEGFDIFFEDISSFSFSILDPDFNIDLLSDFNFSVNGKTNLVWEVDGEIFKKTISGKNKNNVLEIWQKDFSNIEKVEVQISPFWRSKIPTNLEKIEIEILK